MTFLKDRVEIESRQRLEELELRKRELQMEKEAKEVVLEGGERVEQQRNATRLQQTAAATAAKYEYGFIATATSANPGAYVLATKVCRQIELLVKLLKNVPRSESVAYSSLFLNGLFILYLLDNHFKLCDH